MTTGLRVRHAGHSATSLIRNTSSTKTFPCVKPTWNKDVLQLFLSSSLKGFLRDSKIIQIKHNRVKDRNSGRDRETNQLAIHKDGRRFELRTNPAIAVKAGVELDRPPYNESYTKLNQVVLFSAKIFSLPLEFVALSIVFTAASIVSQNITKLGFTTWSLAIVRQRTKGKGVLRN